MTRAALPNLVAVSSTRWKFPDLDGEAFLRLAQPTLGLRGGDLQVALAELPALRSAGADLLRISPQAANTVEVLRVLRAAADGALSGIDARKALVALAPGQLWNGFWHGRPGMAAA